MDELDLEPIEKDTRPYPLPAEGAPLPAEGAPLPADMRWHYVRLNRHVAALLAEVKRLREELEASDRAVNNYIKEFGYINDLMS